MNTVVITEPWNADPVTVTRIRGQHDIQTFDSLPTAGKAIDYYNRYGFRVVHHYDVGEYTGDTGCTRYVMARSA